MTSESGVRRELARFDAEAPIEAAWTPPASWYVDAAFLELEKRAVFQRSWLQAGRTDQVARPGDFVCARIPGREVVIVRDDASVLRAFHNVCRHRATRLLDGAGRCESLECPYHGWTYGLDGRLRSAPRSGGIEGFRREDFGLLPLGLDSVGPLLFVHEQPDTPPLHPKLTALVPQLELDGLQFVARREYPIRCNWKVFVDNYLDGGYHVPVAHRGLAEQLDLGSYRTELFDGYSVQSCLAAESTPVPRGDFAERVGGRQVYAWVYPNLMLNRYGPILDVNVVVPLSVDETLVVFDYYFDAQRAGDADFVARSLAASDRVQQEDTALCERVQTGLQSAVFDRSRYAPKVEAGELHFHRLLAADLRESVAPR